MPFGIRLSKFAAAACLPAIILSGCAETTSLVTTTGSAALATTTTPVATSTTTTTPVATSTTTTTPVATSTTTTTASTTTTTSSTTSTTPGVTTPSVEPSGPCTGRKLGTYTWSQGYWRKGDTTLVDFGRSDIGREWNCGDLYINIADATNYDKIFDQDKLVSWMKQWRHASGNTGRIWLTYGDVVHQDGPKMIAYVQTFKGFLIKSVSKEDMAAIGPIGISFDVEHIADVYYKEALLDSQAMIADVTASEGYPVGSIMIDSTIEGAKNPAETEYVMRYADKALMMLYRNELEGGSYEDDLLVRMRWMLTEQCQVCTQPGWENLKAKITIMVEGSCQMGANCKKLSMCAKDTAAYPDANGGIQYVWDTLNRLPQRMIEEGIVTQAQFDHLFDVDGTLFAIHNWEWSRCFYGDEYSKQMAFPNCNEYHSLAEGCRGQ